MSVGNPPASGFSGLCRPRGSRSLFLPISVTAAGLFYAPAVDLVGRTRELLDAWNENGPEAVGQFAHDDVVLVEGEDLLERDTIFGRAAVVDRLRDRLALVGSSTAALRSVDQLAADRVLADMDLRFEGRVSGVEGDFRMVHLYTWADGLLSRIEEFRDPTSARGLVGAWDLVDWQPRGDSVGRLIYSGDGLMTAFLAGPDGFSDALAYSGTWELRGGEQVVHHVSLATRESFVGKDLVRAVSWEGADLVLTTPPTRDGVVNVLRWRREGD
jgi:ketosteroid isomerase-like protein